MDPVITGIGVVSSIGNGKVDFMNALVNGHSNFSIMSRSGRQFESNRDNDSQTKFIGAEIEEISASKNVNRSTLRTSSLSTQAALQALDEAWLESGLEDVCPKRIGLIVGGSNFQQREIYNIQRRFSGKHEFLRPTYAMNFMDSDLWGVCTQAYGIEGLAFSVGGASASGQLAVLQAIEALKGGIVDVCIAIGALMDLSAWECQAFRSLGAMGTSVYADTPGIAARPFDKNRDGFIYGESCAAIVIENSETLEQRSSVKKYASVLGSAMKVDANRDPNPSVEGEIEVIKQVLTQAGLTGENIDYVNPHGTGSGIGDSTELDALAACNLRSANLNTTKSLIGHGLTAAGTVELAAVLLQLDSGKLHPCLNMDDPLENNFNWVGDKQIETSAKKAINLSYGFCGINTAVCVEKY